MLMVPGGLEHMFIELGTLPPNAIRDPRRPKDDLRSVRRRTHLSVAGSDRVRRSDIDAL
jgi:hypothetical protein